ncbi:MAG: sensor histidine kinase [Ignavibacteriaceae bacterium]
MYQKLFNKIKGDRIYFAIVFFILILIFTSGIITPILVKNLEDNWEKILSGKILKIQNSVTYLYKQKENNLVTLEKKFKSELRSTLNPQNSSYASLLKLVNMDRYKKLSIEVLAPNGKLIAWNNQIAVPQIDILPLSYPAGEAHFYSTELITYLTVTDTIFIDSDQFYFVVSDPIEKHFSLQNPYFENINFTKEISAKYLTQFDIAFNPFEEKTNDGRKYSFDLTNNNGDKIGLVTFYKPALNIAVSTLYETVNTIQSILMSLGFLFVGLGFRKDFYNLKYRVSKFILLTFYLVTFRLLLFYTGFPTGLLEGNLVDPAYFSSTFGGGIVKSPIEFLISSLFFLLIIIKGYQYFQSYLHFGMSKISLQKKYFWIYLFLVSVLFFWAIRGLSATIKSVIFDSTLRYFKEPNLIPNLPSIIMNLSALIFGISVVVVLCGLLLYLTSFFNESDSKKQKKVLLYLYFYFQVFGVIFLLYENEPLITPVISFLFITIVFILTYQIHFVKVSEGFYYICVAIAASVLTITLMNYFNIELEKQSLKTTALEINRPNDNLLRFLIKETLSNSAKNQKIIDSFNNGSTNYSAEAFKLWAESSLQKESINSSLGIYDKNLNPLGNFSIGINPKSINIKQFINDNTTIPKLVEINQPGDTVKKVVLGVIPIMDRGIKVGYLSAVIGYDLKTLFVNDIPDFLESKNNNINSVLDIANLKIFLFNDSKLAQVYGDIYPSRNQIKPILSADFNGDNEAWFNLSLNGQNFFIFAIKTNQNGVEKITAVAARDKKISWDLFNFFKIFLIHSIFIIVFSLLVFATNVRKIKYTFRTQLLIAFLFVSIIPVLILAIYNRQIIEDKRRSAILDELNERTVYLENNIREEFHEGKTANYIIAFQNAARDMNISFAIYDGNNQFYNSRDQFYKSGLFTDRLNPQVYYALNYLNYREYLTQERIENFVYDSYYKIFNLGDRPFIIGVNDAFNKVHLSFSVVDLDVFLFGVYSFATLLMIILSTVLANKISEPIRRLTKATDSVAHGDFNVQLNSTERGEIKELLTGFNSMTNELKKNQSELAELERENAWKEMAKQVAHEIKNPLTPMKLAIQQLIVSYKDKNPNFDSIFEKVSSTIMNQIENLSLIASEFSRFARMPNLNFEKIDLINVINDTTNLFVEEKIKIIISNEVEEAMIESDKTQLRRMLINLIRNSIQAGAKNIIIRVGSSETNYVVLVKDDGSGIPEGIKHKIFEPNFSTKDKGMGLGLKLAKRFLESSSGSISLVDGIESGTEFKIILPGLKV